jgi:DNA repair protein RadC
MMEKELRVRELVAKYKLSKKKMAIIDSPEKTYRMFKELSEEPQEHFYALYLDNKNQVLAYRLISIGTVNETIIHPRDVFSGAVLVNAVSIILIHNHPSGELQSSREDLAVTERLREGGKILGIAILDHIIIGNGYMSFRDQGYLEEVSK